MIVLQSREEFFALLDEWAKSRGFQIQSPVNPDEILTVAEMAAEVKAPQSTISEYCRTGRIPNARKVGKEWRVQRADFEAFKRGDSPRGLITKGKPPKLRLSNRVG
ncbi:helix-turn-helix domain-containing protein [Deinococcus cellulosilyticus]|uniref:Helix-turn-helix domain-containing protein n=1 Tax=Deinococcus cellulosilyticus (strain DSM 18568 / NBRC 106333 / KACC 11606 / 5516J-15) TaxID=1223518 RepID=A0A511N2V4_DEIC1|nr:helix-turn-helix domain-containing protein [Deinococcus cellulosilyticus]GEM47179.1 hypothetical protein DC3_28140 [Deinococcus cellulosilyticus NBRC 106333 = KACC 11606]